MTKKPIGTVLKEIRTAKGLSQKQICGDYMARMTLSKIENNVNSPSYHSLVHILDGLDVSFDELAFLLQRDNSKKKILAKFSQIPDDSYVEELNSVIQLAEDYLKQQADFQIREIKLIAEVMLAAPNLAADDLKEPEKQKLAQLWQRLNQMNGWTLSELKMASTIVVYFPSETASAIGQRILRELSRYEDFAPLQSYFLTVYLNLTSLFIRNKDYLQAEKLNQRALTLAKKLELYHFYYFTMVRKGIFDKDETLITKGEAALATLEKDSYLADLMEEKRQFQKETC
ncbi:helix-turn-helix domain-containing protein [Enterococcus sp. LJL90]